MTTAKVSQLGVFRSDIGDEAAIVTGVNEDGTVTLLVARGGSWITEESVDHDAEESTRSFFLTGEAPEEYEPVTDPGEVDADLPPASQQGVTPGLQPNEGGGTNPAAGQGEGS